MTQTTGWVAADQSGDGRFSSARHAEVRDTATAAGRDQQDGEYDRVYWLHSDGYLYAEQQ